jgi:hypothetical protein
MLNPVRVWNAWFALLLQAVLLGLEAQRVALRFMRLRQAVLWPSPTLVA